MTEIYCGPDATRIMKSMVFWLRHDFGDRVQDYFVTEKRPSFPSVYQHEAILIVPSASDKLEYAARYFCKGYGEGGSAALRNLGGLSPA